MNEKDKTLPLVETFFQGWEKRDNKQTCHELEQGIVGECDHEGLSELRAEGASPEETWWESVPGRASSKHEVPEAETNWGMFGNRQRHLGQRLRDGRADRAGASKVKVRS